MATINDLRTRFSDAVGDHVHLKSYKFGFEFDLNSQKDVEYPLCLVVALESSIANWSQPIEEYRVQMFLYDIYKRDDERNMTEVWENLKNWGYDIIDVVCARSQVNYTISGGVDIVLLPYQGNDRTACARFTLRVNVKDCKNRT